MWYLMQQVYKLYSLPAVLQTIVLSLKMIIFILLFFLLIKKGVKGTQTELMLADVALFKHLYMPVLFVVKGTCFFFFFLYVFT